jgi:protein-S-isoprenylcysteine O-methyltransferase Ste14
MDHISTAALAILVIGFVAWFLPFPLAGWTHASPQKRDPRWRWGLLLEVLAYVVLGAGAVHRVLAPAAWRLALAVFFFALATLLSWTSTRSLGRYLRFEAAVDTDHQLIRSGPYRIVRHPIYASMLWLMLGIASIAATRLSFVVALALFVAGTEIRVRVEDKLLAGRFGDEFRAYRRSTPAYIPLIR